MKSIGVIGALACEIELLLKELQGSREHKHAGFTFYDGRIGSNRVILGCCGVGKVNAALCSQIIIDLFKIQSLINTGIAGSLHKQVKLCDVVISTDVTYHDVRPGQMKGLFPFQTSFQADNELVQRAVAGGNGHLLGEAKVHTGRIVSGDNFVSDPLLRAKIIQDYAPLCVEMEGAAIGHAAFLNSVPFVVIRSISDNADEFSELTYAQFEEHAAKLSAAIVLDMLLSIS